MSVFSGIEKAEVYGGGANIRPGQHSLKVKELLVHRSRQKNGVVYFVAEFEVVASTGDRPTTAKELPEGQRSPLSKPHIPGESVSWIVDMSQPSALSNVKGFAIALAPDVAEADVTEAMMLALVNSDEEAGEVQPARGIVVHADAFVVLTRKGSDFTKIRFSPNAPE
jgi:hypothetical protein